MPRQFFAGRVGSLAVSGDGRKVLVGGMGTWALYELRGRDLVETMPPQSVGEILVTTLAFSPDGTRMLAATNIGEVQLWQIDPPRRLRPVPQHRSAVHTVTFSPDGRRGASSSTDGIVRIFALDGSGEPAVLRMGAMDRAVRVAFVDDRCVVTGGTDGTVAWWWLDAAGLRPVIEAIDIPPLTADEEARFPRLFGR